MRRAYTAHCHAQMLAVCDDGDVVVPQDVFEVLGDVFDKLFLEIEAMRSRLCDAGEFAQPQHFVVRDIADADVAMEGQQMMLAEAPDAHSADDDKLVCMCCFKSRCQCACIVVNEFAPKACDACGRIAQSFACWVFPDCEQDFFDGGFDALSVYASPMYLWT